ncbi:hypothetical protein [Helicobacter sp. T3_23-1056]
MYKHQLISKLVKFITKYNGILDKKSLADKCKNEFGLTKDRSVYYCESFSIRFSKSSSAFFSNTVLSLSALRKYDDKPFLVCIVTPHNNHLLLSNTTFLHKISHSSHKLRVDNIKGSFNGSDIMREYCGISNIPNNFEVLFAFHKEYGFDENLVRLVESTNNIIPIGKKFVPSVLEKQQINDSINRAICFMKSTSYKKLNDDLQRRVDNVKNEIAIASFIDNVNLRGRIIEFLITDETNLKATVMECLRTKSPLPELFTSDDLGDYEYIFDDYHTKTDIKTKILFLSSAPKGYNIDKLLSFLSQEKSVYLIFIVAVDSKNKLSTKLCSMFNQQILSGTIIQHHWAGRNSRGVTQYKGKNLEAVIENFDNSIDIKKSQDFLKLLLDI